MPVPTLGAYAETKGPIEHSDWASVLLLPHGPQSVGRRHLPGGEEGQQVGHVVRADDVAAKALSVLQHSTLVFSVSEWLKATVTRHVRASHPTKAETRGHRGMHGMGLCQEGQ